MMTDSTKPDEKPPLRVWVLRGGASWFDGWLTSRGMDALAAEIQRRIPQLQGRVVVSNWPDYQQVEQAIMHLPKDTRVALVGYSGGAVYASVIPTQLSQRTFELVVGIDPGPPGDVVRYPLHSNIKQALCVYNEGAGGFTSLGFGGGKFRVAKGAIVPLETKVINRNHLAAQTDRNAWNWTIERLKAIV